MKKETIIEALCRVNAHFNDHKFDTSELQRIFYYISNIGKKYENAFFQDNIEKEYSEKETEQKNKTFNGLSAREWTTLSRNVWNDVSSSRKKHHLQHGATYPKALTDRLIKMYSRQGDLVFDPFLGTGTTLLSAKSLNRNGVGIELSEEFFKFASEQLNEASLFESNNIKIYLDDCRNMEKYLQDNTIQVTVTSPPYADFIRKSLYDREKIHKTSKIKLDNNSSVRQYTELDNDFGNLPYEEFLNQIQSILTTIYKKTKVGGYSVWIVKDYRDTKNKIPYVDFHSDLAKVGQKVGFKYHDLIVWDQNEQRSLVLLGYPSVFYTNQNCSFIVVFRKV
ncbi:MAG: site-specific DNA-methyltransferase [Epsilonproteobacteria bacterium]|nr:site-specific DNA-methyltransferase [Campylobacterota bacterium]